MIIGYPGGAGGQWLSTAIDQVPLPNKKYINFHLSHTEIGYKINHRHDCDLLLSGTYYFNFYANHVYKFFHTSMNFYKTLSYSENWLKSVSAAFWICEFDQFLDRIYFNYNDLINNHDNFYYKIIDCQQLLNKPLLNKDAYTTRRQQFIDSCVNVDTAVNNFDDMLWVSFILGQLMYYKITPNFSIAEKENYELCQQFALDNIRYCKLLNFHESDGDKFLLNELLIED
jgi:hypothetical protein